MRVVPAFLRRPPLPASAVLPGPRRPPPALLITRSGTELASRARVIERAVAQPGLGVDELIALHQERARIYALLGTGPR